MSANARPAAASVKALIHWKTESEGGRKSIPSGPRYSTVARFPAAKRWSEEAWSLVVDYEEAVATDGTVKAAVRFLAEGAPADLLTSGGEFELLEGPKVVATGKVLNDGTTGQ